MKLHMAATDDGYQLWGAFLDGRRNDGDGGIGIHRAWFMVARTQSEVRKALAGEIEQTINRYSRWYEAPIITYRPVMPGEVRVCYYQAGDRLTPVVLHEKSADGFSVMPALMDSRS